MTDSTLDMRRVLTFLVRSYFTMPSGELRKECLALLETSAMTEQLNEMAWDLRDEMNVNNQLRMEVGTSIDHEAGRIICTLKEDVEDEPYLLERQFYLRWFPKDDGEFRLEWEEL